ncbi:MAG: helix-hairpin-helix domain-containing protein [Betaproteobacteria bacterium]
MKKIITLAAALFISASGAAFAQKQEAPKLAAAKAETKPAAAPVETKKEPMDINTASEKELATLPKIGDVRAKAIIKGRPYTGKDDLINRKIIPQDAYDAIKEVIIAKQAKKEEAKKDEAKKDAKKAESTKEEKKK